MPYQNVANCGNVLIVTAIFVELTTKAVKNGFFSFGNYEYITVLVVTNNNVRDFL